jgi:hypothetical protein
MISVTNVHKLFGCGRNVAFFSEQIAIFWCCESCSFITNPIKTYSNEQEYQRHHDREESAHLFCR